MESIKIIVGIGTDEQKEQIREELSLFNDILQGLDLHIKISKLVVASDFDKTVNQFQKTTDYRSVRGLCSSFIIAIGKIINIDDGVVIVISSLLFTEKHDSQTRYYIYFHEMTHTINKQRFPSLSNESPTISTYTQNIYDLFDEYYCDRFSYMLTEKCFQVPSKLWQNFIENESGGFTSLIVDPKYYDHLKHEIILFRHYKTNVDEFLENIKPIYKTLAFTITHTYALNDQYPDLINTEKLEESPFINKKTSELMKYFKTKYEQNVFDLNDGTHLILNFTTNFGVKLDDTAQGLYCHVLDVERKGRNLIY